MPIQESTKKQKLIPPPFNFLTKFLKKPIPEQEAITSPISLPEYNTNLLDEAIQYHDLAGFNANQGGQSTSTWQSTGAPEKENWTPTASGLGHLGLGIAGMVPGYGIPFDVADAGWYAAEGDKLGAGLSTASAAAGLGLGANIAALPRKVARAVTDLFKTSAKGKSLLRHTKLIDELTPISKQAGDVPTKSMYIGDPNIPEQDRNYGLAHLKNQIVLDKIRASMRKGLDHYVHKHLKDIEWYDYYRDFTDPKFMKYQPTHDMQLHCDHVGNAVGGKGIPTVSMVGCLNNDYKGGYLRFFEHAGPAGSDYWLNKGDIIYFPSNFLYPHRVTAVTEGLRYSFVSWVW